MDPPNSNATSPAATRQAATPKPRATRGKYISKACDGDAQAIRSLREQVASLQGDLSLLRQASSQQQLDTQQQQPQPPLEFADTFETPRARLLSPDYTDPGSHPPNTNCGPLVSEPPESPESCQPSASYTFNISLARTHLQARGIAMTESEKHGTSSSSADRTRPPSPASGMSFDFGGGSVDPLWLVDEKEAIRLCNVYEVEVGIQYPFLDILELIDKVRVLYKAMANGSRHGFAFAGMPGPSVIDPQDLDLIKMVISAGSTVEAGGSSQLGKALFSGVRKASHDKLWEPAGIKNTMLFVLLAIYSFMTGDDLQAWRLVGISARWCLEIGLHQSATVNRIFKDEDKRRNALRLFWCVYTLDRRWGFGAGLPFVMHHFDVDQHLPEPDDEVPYLKAMVAYSQIGNKVWSTSYNSARTTGAVRDDEISYLMYLIDRWYGDLPESSRLSATWESDDWAGEARGPRRLQLLLHLRANQMKLLLLQPVLHSTSSLKANVSKVQALVGLAKDTIRKLAALNGSTDIYQTQQMCFNHFLVSALGVVFLVAALAPAEYGPAVRDEFHVALDLIRGLSAKSYVSSRLWKMVGDLRLVWRNMGLKPPGQQQQDEERNVNVRRNPIVTTPPPSAGGGGASSLNGTRLSGEEDARGDVEPDIWQTTLGGPVGDVQIAQDLNDFFDTMDGEGGFATPYPMLGICENGPDTSGEQPGEGAVAQNFDPSLIDVSHLFVDML
ncbi:fungal specific transcription factor domain-containing protein [Colletotrichum plurivorum]|uniref:Fungal specific transcription factor domain-containing protein n=1 Tax=Colletotrichum plurivorum TaxID=2175906 RepID=A0A8H6KTR0_9PEZI|nr:fungal specific transcription factor domain-containing protein [Colletotrichum plurivorum]